MWSWFVFRAGWRVTVGVKDKNLNRNTLSVVLRFTCFLKSGIALLLKGGGEIGARIQTRGQCCGEWPEQLMQKPPQKERGCRTALNAQCELVLITIECNMTHPRSLKMTVEMIK